MQLDVSDTLVCGMPGYREYIFQLMSGLQILDNKTKEDKELAYSEDDSSDLLDDDEDEDSSSEDKDAPGNKNKMGVLPLINS